MHLILCHLQAPLGLATRLHIGLALRLQGHDFLLQLRLLKQVIVAGEDGHILGEVHAVLLVHRAFIDDTRAKAVGLQLGDEELFVLQQVELIAVKGTLHSIDDDIHVVVRVELGNLIARTSGTTVTLFQIGRSPGDVDMMDGHGPFLGIYTRTKGRGGAEQDADGSLIHGFYELLALLLVLRLLNETDLFGRDAVVVDQLVLDLLEDVPLAGLVGREVTEDKLRTLLVVILLIVLRHQPCTVAGLVLGVITEEFRVHQSHIERSFSTGIGGDEHLTFLLTVVQRATEDEFSVTRLGKLHQTLVEVLLVRCRLDVMQHDIHIRTVETDILTCAVVGNLVIEGGQLRHLHEVAETLLLDDGIGHGELIV